LGIYEEEENSGEKEQEYSQDKRSKPVVWGSYLAWHAKRQLAYGEPQRDDFWPNFLTDAIDIWWIAAAWLLISIFERSKIWNPSTNKFDLFGILFELVITSLFFMEVNC
jgi:hypothetical protein